MWAAVADQAREVGRDPLDVFRLGTVPDDEAAIGIFADRFREPGGPSCSVMIMLPDGTISALAADIVRDRFSD
ncbi:hypothetical protein ATO13_23186 [Stappia sp. 22II-S9-Z10]|nr:hypothetical protein ATO13_23186 [Stappia sp. 22II-S9-Z10]